MKISKKKTSEVAEIITNNLFKMGDMRTLPCNRIQFMAGKYPDQEKENGGICKSAFRAWLSDQIGVAINGLNEV